MMNDTKIFPTSDEIEAVYVVCHTCKEGWQSKRYSKELAEMHGMHVTEVGVTGLQFWQDYANQSYYDPQSPDTKPIPKPENKATSLSLDGKEPPMGSPGRETTLRVQRAGRETMRAAIPLEETLAIGEDATAIPIPDRRTVEISLSDAIIEQRIREIERITRPLNEELRCLKRMQEIRIEAKSTHEQEPNPTESQEEAT